jgi:DegV family protein with EDD domain
MIGNTAVVVDSSGYLPESVVRDHGLIVVPLNIEIGGQAYREGVDITPDDFYRRVSEGESVSTSQPPPGAFAEAYERAAKEGAEQVLSIHIGSSLSGTVQSATIAAESASVPVTVVDTGQASFAEGLCVLAAIDALAAGASVEKAAEAARTTGPLVGNAFVVRALDLARRGGRLAAGEEARTGVPVMALTPEGMKVLGSASTLEEAVDMMAAQVESGLAVAGGRARVGIGHGAAPEIAAVLRERVVNMAGAAEVIDYVVGPVIGAHTGPGNAGAVWAPIG